MELAPWEEKRKYYKDIQLGKDPEAQINAISNQTREMIASQIAAKNDIIASDGIIDDAADSFTYGIQSVKNGIFGLKAAFEWGISDVVWQIEMSRQELKDTLNTIYASHDEKTKELRKQAKDAYDSGKVNDTFGIFLKLLNEAGDDFTVHMSLGIIHLFNKIEKEKAFAYFNDAMNQAKQQSVYYASYALLYKGLIKRDFGLIEEAEECALQAMEISPEFIEAIYQNAQYNAILNKPDKAVPLLRKAINSDLIYCLKINNEPDFDRIRSEVNDLFNEIRDEKNEAIKGKQKKMKEMMLSLNEITDDIGNLGHDISEIVHIKSLQESSEKTAVMLKNYTIFNSHIVNHNLQQLEKRFQQNISVLKEKCPEIRKEIEDKIHGKGDELKGKSKINITRLIFYIIIGQIVIISNGLTFNSMITIYVAEAILFALCAYFIVIRPRSKAKGAHSLQERLDKLDQMMERISNL